MDLYYETERLTLQVLLEKDADRVLDFYLRNQAVFEAREPSRPANFYTREYQAMLLRAEFQMAVKLHGVRFWLFEKTNPGQIIGTVSFQNVIRSVYQSCQIGYKLDEAYWHRGYAREAILRAIPVALNDLHLHRIEALVLPDNLPSIRLLERLGFEREGVCRSCVYLHFGWADHLMYSYIRPSSFC